MQKQSRIRDRYKEHLCKNILIFYDLFTIIYNTDKQIKQFSYWFYNNNFFRQYGNYIPMISDTFRFTTNLYYNINWIYVNIHFFI